ncbi:MAG: hypothetical protein IPP34_15805 [Bacteroidetes bacterium]|nr:hypothetical protein [Bacteroidota bacterium]
MNLELLFWLAVGLLAFTYAGYGVVIWAVNKVIKPGKIISETEEELPDVVANY